MSGRPAAPEPGLCAACDHVRVVETRAGSRFFRCGLSDVDPGFARYPRLPVLRCAGFRPAAGPGGAEEAARAAG